MAVGSLASMFLPVTGTVMVNRAGQSSAIVTDIARRDPRVYAALVRLRQASTMAQLGMLAGIYATAIAVDIGTMPSDSFLARQVIGDEIAMVEAQRAENERQRDASPQPPTSPGPLV